MPLVCIKVPGNKLNLAMWPLGRPAVRVAGIPAVPLAGEEVWGEEELTTARFGTGDGAGTAPASGHGSARCRWTQELYSRRGGWLGRATSDMEGCGVAAWRWRQGQAASSRTRRWSSACGLQWRAAAMASSGAARVRSCGRRFITKGGREGVLGSVAWWGPGGRVTRERGPAGGRLKHGRRDAWRLKAACWGRGQRQGTTKGSRSPTWLPCGLGVWAPRTARGARGCQSARHTERGQHHFQQFCLQIFSLHFTVDTKVVEEIIIYNIYKWWHGFIASISLERHAKLPLFSAPNTVHNCFDPVFEQSPLKIRNAANQKSCVPGKVEQLLYWPIFECLEKIWGTRQKF
jgi:hypothetical protein